MQASTKLAGSLAAAAMVIGAGVGLASMAHADPSSTATPSVSLTQSRSATQTPSAGQEAGRGGRHGHGPGREGGKGEMGDTMAKKLADKLGLSEDQVATALRDAHKNAPKPTATSTPDAANKPNRDAMEKQLAADLAKSLGVDESKVLSALQSIRADQEATMAADMKTRLDQAVKDGKLSQSEADAVLKAAKAGVIGYGGKGGRH